MAMPKNRSLLFSAGSLLMASIFAYSAAVQLNDPAASVNLLHTNYAFKTSNQIAKLGIGFGMFLHLKVLVEGYAHGLAGFWSLDMRERVVREKLGSGLVVISMFLQLKASIDSSAQMRRKREEAGKYIDWGMALLAAVTLGLSFAFFASVKEI